MKTSRLATLALSFAMVANAANGPFNAKPLADVAKAFAKSTPRGAIVTGEWREGKETFAAAGNPQPAGVLPEKIVFEIGSITKVFTGLLLAQAVVEKKARLDCTIAEILGASQRFADPRVGRITLVQLATHTSGLPRLPSNLAQGSLADDPYAKYDRALLSEALAALKLESDGPHPRAYSNLGAGLLGDLLARIYGQTWEDLVREKIARPLGMADTSVALSAEQQARFAPPFEGEQERKPWHLAALAGAGALRSTAADMIRFARVLAGRGEGTPLKEAIALLTKAHTADGEIGLCLMLGRLDGQRVWEHNGGTGGFRSAMQVFPDARAARVVLANDAELEPEAVLAAARKAGDEYAKREEGPPLAPSALSEYLGVYEREHGVKFTCVARDGKLAIRLQGQSFLTAHPTAEKDRFFLKEVAAEYEFLRQEGRITALVLHQNGRDLLAKRGDEPVPGYIFRKAADLKELTGTYVMLTGSAFVITQRGSTLYAKLAEQPALPVFETKSNWFEYDVVEAALEFLRDDKGKIAALKLHQNGLQQMAVKK